VASYKVLIKPLAVKEIESIPQKDRSRVVYRIQGLAGSPRPHGCEKLSGQEKYRVRQWKYRILYQIFDDEVIVSVVKVAHRREAYK
jgi:mRNA interferase RelE/StbE